MDGPFTVSARCGSAVLAVSCRLAQRGAYRLLGPPMFRFFENLIDPFRAHDPKMPPPTLAGFYWHYTKEVWPVLAALMAIGLVISLIEVSIFRYVGAIVDMLKTTTPDAGPCRLWLDVRLDGGGRGHRPADRDDHPRPSGPAVAGAVVHEPRALADPPLCAPANGRLLHQRFRRAHRLKNHPDRTGAS